MGKRKSKQIPLQKRILVLCEGETEQIYIEGFLRDKYKHKRLYGIKVEKYQGDNFSPLGLVREAKYKIEEAKREKWPYVTVWVVFDKDQHANIPSAISEATNNKDKINIAFSVVCFEFWILLHFEQKKPFFNSYDQLREYIRNHYIDDYDKTIEIYEIVKDKVATAIANAEWCMKQNQLDIDNGIQNINLLHIQIFIYY